MDIPSWSYLAVGQNLLSAMEPLTVSESPVTKLNDIMSVDKSEPISYITFSDFLPESNDILNWIVNHFT